MRIFLSCQQALKPHAVPAYAFWEFYFKNALAEAGHEVIEAPGVDWAEGLTALSAEERGKWLRRTWGRTLDFLRAEHSKKTVDLFLGYLFPEQVDASAVRAIRDAGVPAVNFFCDNMREFTRVPASFASFDLHWVPEAEARALYETAKLPFLYAPMAMWIPRDLRNISTATNDEVIFIGSRDDLREDLLGDAVSRGLNVQVYGPGWRENGSETRPEGRSLSAALRNQLRFLGAEGPRGWAMKATYRFRTKRPNQWIARQLRPRLEGEAYFSATREAQVVIGINRCPTFRRSFSNPLRYSRLRDIEGPMLGACYLTEWAPGLDDLYEPGAEIEVYRDAADLVEKAELLRRDPARRLRLRRAGQARALSDHTIARSVERIAQKLGISGKKAA
jgi:Glycosyl transferases group 1